MRCRNLQFKAHSVLSIESITDRKQVNIDTNNNEELDNIAPSSTKAVLLPKTTPPWKVISATKDRKKKQFIGPFSSQSQNKKVNSQTTLSFFMIDEE